MFPRFKEQKSWKLHGPFSKKRNKTPYPENADINQEKEIEIRKIIRT